MKATILFIALFIIVSCAAQGKAAGIEVEYLETHQSKVMPVYGAGHAVLYAMGNAAIYTNYDDAIYAEGDAFPEKRKLTNNYLKTDNAKKEMLLFDIIQEPFLIKDAYHEFKWNISSETKTTGGYKCIKAITSYRGRQWTAWFTPQVAIPFGPWKLHGLPGLIVEAYDAENEHSYKALKTEFKTSTLFDAAFASLVKTRNKKPITYQQFLTERKEMFTNINLAMQAESRTTESKDLDIRLGPELKYEWEE